MKKEEKVIMYDSDEAATYKTGLSGWVTGDGFYYGEDENLARYAGCTHKKCECGNIMTKGWLKCDDCRGKEAKERYLKFPYKDWDKKAPVVDRDGDNFFFDVDELDDYMRDNELESIDLLFCDPIHYRTVCYDDIAQDAHDDWEPEDKLIDAVKAVNEVIKNLPPHSWTPGKIRTSYSIDLDE